jgi:hypothetical protein
MTVAQTLDIVSDLVKKMEVVMEGAHSGSCDYVCCMKHGPGRWQGIHRRYPEDPWCAG